MNYSANRILKYVISIALFILAANLHTLPYVFPPEQGCKPTHFTLLFPSRAGLPDAANLHTLLYVFPPKQGCQICLFCKMSQFRFEKGTKEKSPKLTKDKNKIVLKIFM